MADKYIFLLREQTILRDISVRLIKHLLSTDALKNHREIIPKKGKSKCWSIFIFFLNSMYAIFLCYSVKLCHG